MMAHSTGLALTGLILASITLQTSLNLLLEYAVCLSFRTRGYTLALGPLTLALRFALYIYIYIHIYIYIYICLYT
jgi:hypothetical protein